MASTKVITGDKNIDNKNTNKKQKIAVIGIIIAIIAAIILLIVVLNLNKNNNNDFDVVSNIYSKNHISYTVDDYNKDKEAIDAGETATSDGAKQLSNKNNKVIKSLADLYSPQGGGGGDTPGGDDPKPGPSYDDEAFKTQLLAKVKDMYEFVNYQHPYGLENTEFRSKSGETIKDYREVAYKDIKNVEKYMQTGVKTKSDSGSSELNYWAASYEDMSYGLRYSADKHKTFDYQCIKVAKESNFQRMNNWFHAGHPLFTKIYTLGLEEVSSNIGNETCQIKGTITTDNGNYVVYSNLSTDESGNMKYQFYDIEKI